MLFTDVRLQNFRSYEDSSFELGLGVTIVVGPNAAGKTNLLEAIMFSAVGKIYRNSENLIRHNQQWARIDTHTSENSVRSVKIQKTHEGPARKEIITNGKTYLRLPHHQRQPTVLFEPNHLFLLHGEPQTRRNYLDDLLEQESAGYNKIRNQYKRTLSQRNSLLKQGALDRTLLFALNVKMIETASQIVQSRQNIIEKINEKLSGVYSSISANKTEVRLIYKSTTSLQNYSANLLRGLESSLGQDRARGFTSFGPHRDDFSCRLGAEAINTVGSRGETRTLLLALKIIETGILEQATDKKPLLLLDDVFSELDGARRKALVNFLKNHQTIITTTDADIITKNFSQNCHIIPL